MNHTELLDLFRSYPGGLKALALDCGVVDKTLYKVAEGRHRLVPAELLQNVRNAFGSRHALGAAVSMPRLLSLWQLAHKDFCVRLKQTRAARAKKPKPKPKP